MCVHRLSQTRLCVISPAGEVDEDGLKVEGEEGGIRGDTVHLQNLPNQRTQVKVLKQPPVGSDEGKERKTMLQQCIVQNCVQHYRFRGGNEHLETTSNDTKTSSTFEH